MLQISFLFPAPNTSWRRAPAGGGGGDGVSPAVALLHARQARHDVAQYSNHSGYVMCCDLFFFFVLPYEGFHRLGTDDYVWSYHQHFIAYFG